MPENAPSNAELDATGLICPLPVLKARKRLAALGASAVLTVRSDDPAARVDFPHFCNEQGHTLVSVTDGPGGVITFEIRKGAAGD
jgi:tRNA 2-thiouridine synthesizing protein A